MFKLQFSTDNASFGEISFEAEVIRRLNAVITHINQGRSEGPVIDSNGNRVGEWSLDND